MDSWSINPHFTYTHRAWLFNMSEKSMALNFSTIARSKTHVHTHGTIIYSFNCSRIIDLWFNLRKILRSSSGRWHQPESCHEWQCIQTGLSLTQFFVTTRTDHLFRPITFRSSSGQYIYMYIYIHICAYLYIENICKLILGGLVSTNLYLVEMRSHFLLKM